MHGLIRWATTRWFGVWTLAGAAMLAAAPSQAGAGRTVAFNDIACPASVAKVADCHSGRDAAGAWVLVAMPKDWNRRLVVHAHGGPRLGKPEAGDAVEDVDRFAAMVRGGYAWIGSSYRRGGYGVRVAAADVDSSRRLFWQQWGKPQRTLLHGQSWGGNVAAKVAELHALDDDGHANYDGVLTTNGLLFGGTRAYGFRADLRAVYQFFCGNHPKADEARYPLWQGLPAGSTMTREELRRRVDACTGVDAKPSRRTAGQAARLRDILAVTGIAEAQLVSHLAWGTFHFRDLVQRHLGGRNPFDNRATVYQGSRDDAALNAGIARFAADPAAVATLAYDADLSGLIVLPTVTIHARRDPIVSADAQNAYATTVKAAGRSDLLAQFSSDEDDHSRLREASYMSALLALEQWLDRGAQPDRETIRSTCVAAGHDAGDCLFDPR